MRPDNLTLPRGAIAPLLLGSVLAAACDSGPPRVGPPPEQPPVHPRLETHEVVVEPVAQDLEIVWGLDVAPDGRVFLTERPGRIRVIHPGSGLATEPWAEVEVWAQGESGLLGLALHPVFPDSPYVFVMYTYRGRDGEPRGRVSRFDERAGRGADERVVIDRIPAANRHSGGALAFGPDGRLYVGTGDAGSPGIAQKLESLGGKILRINADGSVPEDNPFEGSPIYALGLRNVQGFDWDPDTGRMIATMHGPTGEWGNFGHDEINVIEPGANYGWPKYLGAPREYGFADPWLEYERAVAPAGAAFYDGPVAEWRGDFLFATLRGESLHRVILDDDRVGAHAVERLWPDVYGRIRALAVGPDGTLYFGTSNRDGRGAVRTADDHLYRVVPADAPID